MKQHTSTTALVSERSFCVQLKKLATASLRLIKLVKLTKLIVAPLIITLAAFAVPERIFAEVPDSCLYVQPDSMAPDWKNTNPDSVALDTCSSSSTYRRWYSKRYDAYFKVDAFHLGYGSPDSVMVVHWEDIDTTYAALRDSFESIYDQWGPFYFKKVNPEDTSHAFESFKIIFDEYLLAYGGVLDDLRKIMTDGLVEISFTEPHDPPLKIVLEDKKLELTWFVNGKKLIVFSPRAMSFLEIQVYDLLGRKTGAFKSEQRMNNQYEINLVGISPGVYLAYIENFQSSFLFIVH